MNATPTPSSLPIETLIAFAVYALILLGLMAGSWVWLLVRKLMGENALPEPKPQRVPWNLASVCLVAVAYLTLQVVVGAVYRLVIPRAAPDAPVNPRDLLAVTTISNLLLIPVVLFLLRLTSGTRLAHFGFGWSPIGRDLALGFWGCFLLAPIIYLLNICIVLVNMVVFKFRPTPHPVFTMVQDRAALPLLLFALLTAVVVAPLVEELLFRGILLGWMTKWFARFDRASAAAKLGPAFPEQPPGDPTRPEEYDLPTQVIPADELPSWNPPHARDFPPAADSEAVPPSTVAFQPPVITPEDAHQLPDAVEPGSAPARPAQVAAAFTPSARARWTANLIVSLIFAGLHFPQWPAPIPLFFLSLGLGVLAQRTGGLIAPIAMHASFNAISTIGLAILFLTGGLQNMPDPFQGLK